MSKKVIAVFGATGCQGSSVLKSLLKNGNYHVRAITRNANSEKAKKLSSENCTVVEADLDNPQSLDDALKGCYGVFLVTDSKENFAEKELEQGINTIDMAIKNGVSHFIFSGLEHVESILNKPCIHFDYKFEIENYALKKSDKINFTSVRLPAYFENFGLNILTVKSKENEFLVNAPLEGKPMFGMCVDDTGDCVLTIFENPQEYKSNLIGLSGDFLKISDYVAIMNKNLAPNKFIDANITANDYGNLPYPGSKDRAVLFEFYQTGKMVRDINLSKKLNKNLLNFESWVVKNKQNLLNSFK
jgi:uncharacterized protein YbjT (DUF2867 family)